MSLKNNRKKNKKLKLPVPENGPYISNIGTVVSSVCENVSPGLPLTLDNNSSQQQSGVVGDTNNSTTNNNNKYNTNNNSGSPESSLIVLQPSGYSSMLPSFSHYATGKFSLLFYSFVFLLVKATTQIFFKALFSSLFSYTFKLKIGFWVLFLLFNFV